MDGGVILSVSEAKIWGEVSPPWLHSDPALPKHIPALLIVLGTIELLQPCPKHDHTERHIAYQCLK